MEILKTTGIVLRTHPVTETSLIVTWLTREFGKLRTMAKGARRPKSPFRGAVEPFYLDEVLFLRSRRSDLHILHECSVLEPFRRLRTDYAKIAAASCFCELADLATAPEHTEPNLFALLRCTLQTLNEHAWHPLLGHHYEVNLLAALGFDPSHLKLKLPPDLMKLVQRLREMPVDQLPRLRITPKQAETLDGFLAAQLEHQFGRLPRARRFVLS